MAAEYKANTQATLIRGSLGYGRAFGIKPKAVPFFGYKTISVFKHLKTQQILIEKTDVNEKYTVTFNERNHTLLDQRLRSIS